MQTHDLVQGSPEWLAYRKEHFNASDAPAMMGCSPYKTRDQLLYEMHTGLTPEIDPVTQARFDNGHRFEALARPLAEKIIGEELYPVTGSEGLLSASFDGLTMIEDTAFEHKSLNNDLRAAFDDIATISPEYRDTCSGKCLPMVYRVQMEQQIMVSGCARVLFMASEWDENDQLIEERHCWYVSDPELADKIRAGWDQFATDLAAYVAPEPKAAPVVAAPQETLPAVSVKVDGQLAIVSNLPDFGNALRQFIEKIPTQPSTDQEFADTEAACRSLKRAEEALEAAEQNALAQLSDVDTMRRLVADFKALARSTRLQREKLVAQRKDQIREEIVMEGRKALNDHIASLNARLGKAYMPAIAADFAGAIKGKRTIGGLRDAVNTTLANAKIEASAIADRIQANLTALRERAADHTFLFADTAQIVLRQPDDVTNLITARLAEHQAKEAARLEAQREQIRREEEAKAARAAREAHDKARAAVAAIRFPTPAPEVAAELPKPAPAMENAIDYGLAALGRKAVQMAEQVDMVKAFRASEPATLKLGEICARLGITLTASVIEDVLGIAPAKVEKASKLYRPSDFARICDALIAHVQKAKAGELQDA